jgi:hypothetical protein
VRWLALWLVLAVSYAGGWVLAHVSSGAGGTSGAGDLSLPQELAAAAAVPLVQLLALAVVALVRRHGRRAPPGG